MRGKSKRYPLGKITVGFIALYMLLSCNSGDSNRQRTIKSDESKSQRPHSLGDLKTVKRLAEQGDADAQHVLGLMYYTGESVEKDYQSAVKWYTLAAKQGHPDAQYHLGRMYRFGWGISFDTREEFKGEGLGLESGFDHPLGDPGEAVKWFTLAAQQGVVTAQNELGRMYRWGDGVETDYREAVKWYTEAAEAGDADAQYRLGVMYASGEGTQDYSEAVKWWTLAAQQGHATAQYKLGRKYHAGMGVEKDYITAHFWFNLAAAQGNQFARRNRDRLAQEMTPAQITKAQQLAREWKPAKTTQ